MAELDIKKVVPLIEMAIEEDLGAGDLTSRLFFKDTDTSTARIVCREEIIVCGMPVAEYIFKQYDQKLKFEIHIDDGQAVPAGSRLATAEGPLGPMLAAERVMLNFLQRLSGIATTTNKYVQAVAGTEAKIYDTRKTTPGWRILEKYAVRCGGGHNHRAGLYDGILIKDNHLAQLGDNFQTKLAKIIADAGNIKDIKFVAVEVDRIDDQLNQVFKISGIDIVLLDNMAPRQLKHAVDMRNKMYSNSKKPLLEASGNITLENVTDIARCGIDRIAVGAITHSARAVDIGLDRE